MKRIFIILALILTTWTLVAGAAMESKSSWQDFLLREGKDWRVNFQHSGPIRTIYGKSAQPARSPESLIHDYNALLGITRNDELRLARKEIFDTGIEYVYQQYLSGIPIAGAEVHLNFDRDSHLIGI